MNMRAWSILLAAALIYIYHSILRQYAQVCEYARTWKRNSLVIKWMMF